MQLVDELSMIYTTCLMFYATFSYGQSRRYAVILGMFLVCLAVFITGYYHYLQDPTFHQNAYAVLTAIVLFRAMYIMETKLRPSLQSQDSRLDQADGANDHKASKEQDRKDIRDGRILKTMWTMIAFGLSIFLGGFAIWSLDNQYCSKLISWRRQIGLPWGIVLEGHGWWYVISHTVSESHTLTPQRHVMTGTGAYFYIVWGIWLRHCLNGKHDEYVLVWPSLFSFPAVVHRKLALVGARGSMPNGMTKKEN